MDIFRLISMMEAETKTQFNTSNINCLTPLLKDIKTQLNPIHLKINLTYGEMRAAVTFGYPNTLKTKHSCNNYLK